MARDWEKQGKPAPYKRYFHGVAGAPARLLSQGPGAQVTLWGAADGRPPRPHCPRFPITLFALDHSDLFPTGSEARRLQKGAGWCPMIRVGPAYSLVSFRIGAGWGTRRRKSDPLCAGTRAAASSPGWCEAPPDARRGFGGESHA